MAQQIEIDYMPGLLEQFPTFHDVVKTSVYGCGKPFKTVAADLDMSASELSRKLAENPNDPVHFALCRFSDLLTATGDLRPLYWLIEKHLEDQATKQRRTVERASQLIEELARVLPGLKAQG